jgi:hypothetical protein
MVSAHCQDLYKEVWIPDRGGKLLTYVLDKSGSDLLKKVDLQDIIPDKKYFLQSYTKKEKFFPTVFNKLVSWSTITELSPRIYEYKSQGKGE